nr:putative 6-phosphofructo-2-kinase pb17e12.14c [Quercus suber]
MPHKTTTLWDDNIHAAGNCTCAKLDETPLGHFRRRQSQQSVLARRAMESNTYMHELHRRQSGESAVHDGQEVELLRDELDKTLSPPDRAHGISATHFGEIHAAKRTPGQGLAPTSNGSLAAALNGNLPNFDGATRAMNDTPATTAPGSPNIKGDYFPPVSAEGPAPVSLGQPLRERSGTTTPRVRPTTLDIPGLTKSKVSPDGRIARRDVGAKLVIVMVGLPARGKSYITKKLARYMNWLQHDTKIFNVGERRRVIAGGPHSLEKTKSQMLHEQRQDSHRTVSEHGPTGSAEQHDATNLLQQPVANAASIILNGETKLEPPATPPRSTTKERASPVLRNGHGEDEDDNDIEVISQAQKEQDASMEQDAEFFDPANKKASQIREQCARETLDDLLDYILEGDGSVGIFDATNSTLERRKMIMDRVRERAGPDLNVLFLESKCEDQDLLEANMRLKLNGPDYKEMDPVVALEDFRKRVKVYEKAYVPLGAYEEAHQYPYIQMIDVGRKLVSHQVKGFLSAQANYYLLNFNLAPRQIWITRHGLSLDNISGKIGGDSELAPEGRQYARILTRFMDEKRKEWDLKQIENLKNTHFPPQPGDVTPPNPHYQPQSPVEERAPTASLGEQLDKVPPGFEPKSFCVWTSMLKRSIATAEFFNEEEYDMKQMRMLDELNAGLMEGLTYSCISTQFPQDYNNRKRDKLHYRYPGPGGEGYLDIINRLRPVIVELERMTDHVLLIGHRSVARVLLAYFRGLKREEVADLDVPLGMLYCLEPKPYGVDFKAYQWHKDSECAGDTAAAGGDAVTVATASSTESLIQDARTVRELLPASPASHRKKSSRVRFELGSTEETQRGVSVLYANANLPIVCLLPFPNYDDGKQGKIAL